VGQVSITIRGRQYQIACDDGQEANLARLGRYLDQKAEQAVPNTSSVSEPLLLVMVALIVADELSDTTAALDAAQGAAQHQADVARATAEKAAAAAIDSVSDRIERIAARLSGT
jgi:cell division protein ZapA